MFKGLWRKFLDDLSNIASSGGTHRRMDKEKAVLRLVVSGLICLPMSYVLLCLGPLIAFLYVQGIGIGPLDLMAFWTDQSLLASPFDAADFLYRNYSLLLSGAHPMFLPSNYSFAMDSIVAWTPRQFLMGVPEGMADQYYLMGGSRTASVVAGYFWILSLFPVILFLWTGLLANPWSFQYYIPGADAQWASLYEVRKMELLATGIAGKKQGFVNVLGCIAGRRIMMPETLLALCFAPAGAGKTQKICLPTLFYCTTSIEHDGAPISNFVHDVKPELFSFTGKYLSRFSECVFMQFQDEENPAKGIYYPKWSLLARSSVPDFGGERDIYISAAMEIMCPDEGGKDSTWTQRARLYMSNMFIFGLSKVEGARLQDMMLKVIDDNGGVSLRTAPEMDIQAILAMMVRYGKADHRYYKEIENRTLMREILVTQPIGTWDGISSTWYARWAKKELCIPMVLDIVAMIISDFSETNQKEVDEMKVGFQKREDQLKTEKRNYEPSNEEIDAGKVRDFENELMLLKGEMAEVEKDIRKKVADAYTQAYQRMADESRTLNYPFRCTTEFQNMAAMPQETRQSVMMNVSAKFGTFSDNSAAVRAIEANDVDPKDFRGVWDRNSVGPDGLMGDYKPLNFFLGVKTSQVKTFAPITGVFVQTLAEWLINYKMNPYKAVLKFARKRDQYEDLVFERRNMDSSMRALMACKTVDSSGRAVTPRIATEATEITVGLFKQKLAEIDQQLGVIGAEVEALKRGMVLDADGIPVGPCRVNFVLDEFGQLPKMEVIFKIPDVGRSNGISMLLLTQVSSQIKTIYGDDGLQKFWSSPAAHIVLKLGPDSFVVDNVTKMIGKTTRLNKTYKYGGSMFNTAKQGPESAPWVAEDFITPAELGSLETKMKDKHIVIYQGYSMRPILADSVYAYKDPNLKPWLGDGAKDKVMPPALPGFMVARRKFSNDVREVGSVGAPKVMSYSEYWTLPDRDRGVMKIAIDQWGELLSHRETSIAAGRHLGRFDRLSA